MTITDDIKRDLEVIDAATEGPWTQQNWGDGDLEIVCTAPSDRAWVPILFRATHHGTEADARFITNARTRWPEYVAEVQRLQKQAKLLSSAVSFFASVIKCGEPWTEMCQVVLEGVKALDEASESGGEGS